MQNAKVGKCCYTNRENVVIQTGKMLLYKVGKRGKKKIGICDQISQCQLFPLWVLEKVTEKIISKCLDILSYL